MKSFPSKILLFGEYTLMQGSNALAIPFPQFSGKLDFLADSNPHNINSNRKLFEVLEKLKRSETLIKKFNLTLFEKELKNGLYFGSNIPLNYGLGSSGALTAALYDRYILEKAQQPELLNEELAQLESVFHGKSSGIDPLVSYSNKPILFSPEHIEIIDNPIDISAFGFFLLDSGLSRDSKQLISIFFEKSKSIAFDDVLQKQIIPEVNQCISSLREQNVSAFYATFKKLSELQFQYFEEMIPPAIKQIWEEGLKTDDFYLKLCGAGGGGYFLGCKRNLSTTSLKTDILL